MAVIPIERHHIEQEPEGERTEIREIFRRKGLDGDELEAVVKRITSERDLWVQTMVTEEYGLPPAIRSPWLAAIGTFTAFALCGAVPLLPYVLGVAQSFALAAILTAAVFLAIAAARGQWVGRNRWRAAAETLGVGSIAAGLAYAAGLVLTRLV